MTLAIKTLVERQVEQTLTTRPCAFRGCRLEGLYKPVLKVPHFPEFGGPTRHLSVELGIFVCTVHKEKDPKAYLSDGGWKIICSGCDQSSVPYPDRDSVSVMFYPYFFVEKNGIYQVDLTAQE